MPRLPAKTLLILFIVATFATDAAQVHASCGDYLHTRHSRPAASLAAETHQFSEAVVSESPIRRCAGPNCRQRDDLPPGIPPTVVPPVPSNDGLCASGASTEHNHDSPRCRVDSDAVARPGFPQAMERPPRFGH